MPWDKVLKLPRKEKESAITKINLKKAIYMQVLAEETMKKYAILKCRMKISYSAFKKGMTIHELFYRTILSSYEQLLKQNKVDFPWPPLHNN